MEKISTILDFIALFIQIIGTRIMYKNSPENKSNVAQSVGFGESDYATPKRKNILLKKGFMILGIGFAIQFISMIIKLFTK